MNFNQFVVAVNNLVRDWHPGPNSTLPTGVIPRTELERIYNDVREQVVKECADWQEHRDKALALIHSSYVKGGGK